MQHQPRNARCLNRIYAPRSQAERSLNQWGLKMQNLLFKMTMGLGIAVLAAQQVQARTCAARDDVVTRLAETYGETRRGIGIARQGAVMELFASDETGTWTITVTLPDGTMCLVVSGQAYEAVTGALPPNA